jgi:hypothetical protein
MISAVFETKKEVPAYNRYQRLGDVQQDAPCH